MPQPDCSTGVLVARRRSDLVQLVARESTANIKPPPVLTMKFSDPSRFAWRSDAIAAAVVDEDVDS